MKECKYSKILPCYTDGYGVWHYSDDTHDKVCDLGNTMNDPMKPLSKEAIQEIAKALEITRNPKDIMEEKKTNKMTKAEAFEWLKDTKVLCKDYDKMEEVQDFVRSLGFYWADASEEMMLTHTLFLHKDGRLSFALSLQYFREHKSPELSADDILSIEIVDEKQCKEEDAFDLISTVGARLSEVLRRMEGHKHVVITEDDVILYDEGMCLFHSDPF